MICSILFISLSLTACLDTDDPTIDYTPVSGIAIYQGVPDVSMTIKLDSQKISTSEFKFGSYSNYYRYEAGTRKFEFLNFSNNDSLTSLTYFFDEGKFYSIYLTGEDDDIRPLLLKDEAIEDGQGKAIIRFVNLIPDADRLSLKIKADESNLYNNVVFRGYTSFAPVDSQPAIFEVLNENDEVVATATSTQLLVGKYYTIICQGYENPEDDQPEASIKILTNS
ncbi:DUF4397 domain-containing protein [Fulvivirga ligni]|uniref:DUF4397 domain-containing protein n=1 Tax=Fulvivirga ligni TaxID=2904246 RepID=UPI001F17001E|nr:DUF4397 domain-containing protein [Fulvivirga ligni]UII20987.1 DUF4397 domain-containing protein [Fulvivirga ligni]